jgi:dTDP-4-amino-4,6-dideoxygalactose transaminase
MYIKRILPPAAAPLTLSAIFNGFRGLKQGQPEIDKFKEEIKNYFQVEHCFLLSSGKAALTIILMALHRISPDRNEVLIPAFTCYSVPSAIVRAGLKVRLTDINPKTLDYDFEGLKKSLINRNKLLAIICPNLYGIPCNITKIRDLLDNPKISIIEDSAQAMGGFDGSKYLGSLGDVGFFSLGRGKPFSTVQGGIIITDSADLAEEIHLNVQKEVKQSDAFQFKIILYAIALSILIRPSIFWLPKSMPVLRIGDTIYDAQFPIQQFLPFQAGLARNWEKRIDSLQQVRRNNVHYWQEALTRFSWLQPINNKIEASSTHPLIRFPVMVIEAFLRNVLINVSEKKGLGIMPSYPNSIDNINDSVFKHDGQTFPGAMKCASQLVTFPVHGFVTAQDRQNIMKCLDTINAKYHSQVSV